MTPELDLEGKVERRRMQRSTASANGGGGSPRTGGRGHERFKLTAIADLELDGEPLYLVDGLIPSGPSLGVIFGKPKSGKTFLTADLFLHVAMGRDYCGCAVRQGAVVYITSEGVRGFKRRLIAMRRHHKIEAGVPFYTVNTMPNLGSACGDADALIAAIGAAIPPGTTVSAIIIDTLARAMTGQSDSDGAAMGMFVANCDTIARAFGCFVGAVHHSPRNDDSHSRGSNVLDGAADVIVSVVKDDASGVSTARIDRLKDGEDGATWRFRVTLVEVPDRNKNVCFAPLCETLGTVAGKAEAETRRNTKVTPSQRRFIDVLAEAILDHGEAVSGSTVIPTGIKAVAREKLRKCLFDAGFLDFDKPDAARSTFSRTINDLTGKHVIGATNEHVWLPR